MKETGRKTEEKRREEEKRRKQISAEGGLGKQRAAARETIGLSAINIGILNGYSARIPETEA